VLAQVAPVNAPLYEALGEAAGVCAKVMSDWLIIPSLIKLLLLPNILNLLLAFCFQYCIILF
jgi:hypothetical protein